MRRQAILVLVFSSFFFSGCATILTGYYDSVELTNAPDSLRVYTQDGVEIPVQKSTVRVKSARFDNVYETRPLTEIKLRSNLDPVLVLKSGTQEKRVQAFGKIHAGWFTLDVLLVFPWVVDAITGNWNTYEPIDASL